MTVIFKPPTIFARQPLAALGKVSLIALLSSAALCLVLAVAIVGLPDGIALVIVTGVVLLSAGLVATGMRWAPLLGTLASAALIVSILFVVPYPAYDLTHPQARFSTFVMDVLILASLLVAFGATLGATVQNYRGRERRTPGWLPSALSGVVGIAAGAILIGAISQPVTATGMPGMAANGQPTVRINPDNFLQSSVTVGRGATLQLVDDGPFPHVLANGTWVNGVAQPKQEPGAPVVNNVQVNGNSVAVGPFTAAGTYQLYCTIHPGINLTVVVP